MDIEYMDIVTGEFLFSILVANIVFCYWSIRYSVVRGGGFGKFIRGLKGIVLLTSCKKLFIRGCKNATQYPRILYPCVYLTSVLLNPYNFVNNKFKASPNMELQSFIYP